MELTGLLSDSAMKYLAIWVGLTLTLITMPSWASHRGGPYPNTLNTVDATQMAGSDPCIQIANALTALFNSNNAGGWVDARGFNGTGGLTCTVNPFAIATFPASNGNFMPRVLFGAATFLVQVPWIIPSRVILEGMDQAVTGNTPILGTFLQAANNFPNFVNINPTVNDTPNPGTFTFTTSSTFGLNQMVQFLNNSDTLPAPLVFNDWYWIVGSTSGCGSGCTVSLANTPGGTGIHLTTNGSGTHKMRSVTPLIQAGSLADAGDFQITVDKIGLQCETPNGTFPAGAVGLAILNAQEDSHFSRIHVTNCVDNWGIVIGESAGNGNVYESWRVDENPALTTLLLPTYGCLYVSPVNHTDTADAALAKGALLRGFNCYINEIGNNTVTIPALVYIDHLVDLKISGSYFELNKPSGSGTVTVNNVIQLGTTNSAGQYQSDGNIHSVSGFSWENFQSGGAITVGQFINAPYVTGPLQFFNMNYGTGTPTTFYSDQSGNCSPSFSTNSGTIGFLSMSGTGAGIQTRHSDFIDAGANCPDLVGSHVPVVTCTAGFSTTTGTSQNGLITLCR